MGSAAFSVASRFVQRIQSSNGYHLRSCRAFCTPAYCEGLVATLTLCHKQCINRSNSRLPNEVLRLSPSRDCRTQLCLAVLQELIGFSKNKGAHARRRLSGFLEKYLDFSITVFRIASICCRTSSSCFLPIELLLYFCLRESSGFCT